MTATPTMLTADQLTQPFVESTKAVFATMLGCNVELTDACYCSPLKAALDLSGIIGFTGAIRGTILISMDCNVAFSVAEVLLGSRPTSIDADVRDIVGELANMVGGNAKERLNHSQVSLGLPTVVSGHGYEISLDPSAEIHQLCFATPWGPLAVHVALRQVA